MKAAGNYSPVSTSDNEKVGIGMGNNKRVDHYHSTIEFSINNIYRITLTDNRGYGTLTGALQHLTLEKVIQ